MQKGNRNELDVVSVLKMLAQSDRDLMSLCPRTIAPEETEARGETEVSASPDGEALCGIKMHRPHNNCGVHSGPSQQSFSF